MCGVGDERGRVHTHTVELCPVSVFRPAALLPLALLGVSQQQAHRGGWVLAWACGAHCPRISCFVPRFSFFVPLACRAMGDLTLRTPRQPLAAATCWRWRCMAPALPNLPLRHMSGLSYPSALILFPCLHAPECRAHTRRGREKTRTCVDGACYDASPCAPLAMPALAAPSPHHTRSVIIRSAHNVPIAFGKRLWARRRTRAAIAARGPFAACTLLCGYMHMHCRCCMTPTMPATCLQRALDITAHSADMPQAHSAQEARGRRQELYAPILASHVCARLCHKTHAKQGACIVFGP